MKIENLNLTNLKYFLDAVECQSFTKAAEINYVTRSAISQAIYRLEEWCHKRLITHERKKIVLTPYGEVFYRQSKAAFLQFEDSLKKGIDEGALRLGCSASLAEHFLLPLLKGFKNIKSLHLITGTSRFLEQKLEERSISIALFIATNMKLSRNDIIIHQGEFFLASKSGKLDSTIITTENREEVIALKQHFQNKDIVYHTVESWTVLAKIAVNLGYACLIPDFLFETKLKRIKHEGFKYKYTVVLRHIPRHNLSENEIAFFKKAGQQRGSDLVN